MPELSFRFTTATGSSERRIAIRNVVLCGWTGRDRAAVQRHVDELAGLGIKPPATVPVFYRVAASRLTQADEIEVSGEESSGEVEFILIQTGGALWVGTASDHTDRKVESYGITVAKQMCDKPVAGELWPYAEVQPHWDRLVLRSWAVTGQDRELYQEGEVAAMLSPESLIGQYTAGGALPEGTAMFGGTLPAKGGIRPAHRFEFAMEDPVLRRSIGHGYDVRSLPVLG